MSIEEDRFNHYASKPFVPPVALGGTLDASTGLRIANALEYIAAQLGEINRKLGSAAPTSNPHAVNAIDDLKDRAIRADLEQALEIIKKAQP